MTAVATVSIDEGKNKEVEIPRYDLRDKSKLWISKADIHHNTMMQKIRPLVQGKLYEMVSKDNDFFNGIEDAAIEIEEVEGQPKPESEADILLAKKAQMLTDILNAIMELPKDEILDFLTSSSLPAGLNRKNKPKQRETPIEETPNDENYDYNWILDCGDAWKDLPAVVRINAMELGYNQKLWDEDAQDLPVFRTLWKDLKPNQRTAAIFLGSYTEAIWDEDAKIMMMGVKKPPIEDDESSQDESHSEAKEDATIATASTDMSGDRSDNDEEDDDSDNKDDDDDDTFDEFLSNFASDANGEEEEVAKKATKDETEDEDAMMDEFLSNFGGNEEAEVAAILDKAEDEEAMMDEFLANFGTTDEETKKGAEKQSRALPTETRVPQENNAKDDEDAAMMDEFMSNFAGEGSPLLATSKETKAATDAEEPDEEPSVWDTVSSYLYWIPVMVGLPTVYMMATGSKDWNCCSS